MKTRSDARLLRSPVVQTLLQLYEATGMYFQWEKMLAGSLVTGILNPKTRWSASRTLLKLTSAVSLQAADRVSPLQFPKARLKTSFPISSTLIYTSRKSTQTTLNFCKFSAMTPKYWLFTKQSGMFTFLLPYKRSAWDGQKRFTYSKYSMVNSAMSIFHFGLMSKSNPTIANFC